MGRGARRLPVVRDRAGAEVHAYDDGGDGPDLVIVHGAQDDGRAYGRLARRLTSRYRVLRLVRRQYRMDLPDACAMGDEVDQLVSLAEYLVRPLLFGHSSGGVVALEALVAAPVAFAAAAVYEPPIVIGPPLGDAAAAEASAALAAGKPARAMAIFTRAMVGAPALSAVLSGTFVASSPRHRPFIPRVLADVEAIDASGNRLPAYAAITVPLALVEGDRSPAHFHQRLDALAAAVPTAARVVVPRRGHTAPVTSAGTFARVLSSALDELSP